ncbi:hypothetical protein DQW50_15360 [Halorubrum sp. 48-1-W]|uniref:hypothetical protein n=1 Tax=Halorubrum sp. 48-1-W TaxID=2249761 RepID=UPI000DCCFD96|nr:hypothetical protein DQW50_15360 [Halorubrum sp. 48-1-W]
MDAIRRAIDVVRDATTAVSRPEHTGENRCLPCTAVNAVGVAVVAVLLGRRRRALGLLTALGGASAIWLRGYVVPGTPGFAPRLVEPLPVSFGPDRDDGAGSGSLADGPGSFTTDDTEGAGTVEATAGRVDVEGNEGETAVDAPDAGREDPDGIDDGGPADSDVGPTVVMESLLDAGVLVDDAGTLRLADDFRTALGERIGTLRDGTDRELAERAASIAGEDVTGAVHDGRVLLDGRRDAWLSRPIALAETALGELLLERDIDAAVARASARPLRAFLETCPACCGPIRDTTLRNCCGGPGGVSGNPERAVRACADCDAVVFTDRSAD